MTNPTEHAPAWFTRDLPYPIAHAWHLAHIVARPDDMALAGVIEVALRFVASIQIADLRSQNQPLPAIFANGGFAKPSLGGWIRAVKELRAANAQPLSPMLSRWPDNNTAALLDALVTTRNKLGHPGAMTPRQRSTHTDRIEELSVAIITSLEWLRNFRIIAFIDATPTTPGSFDGGVQIYRGAGNLHPRREPHAWTGTPSHGLLYLLPPESDGEPLQLLALSPWLDVGSIKDGLPENMSLFSAIGLRGDIQVWDDAADTRAWRPFPAHNPRVPIQMRPLTAVHDARTATIDSILPPTHRHRGPPSTPAPTTRRPRAPIIAGLAATAAIAVGATMFVVQPEDRTEPASTPVRTDAPASHREISPRLPSPEEAFPAGHAGKPSKAAATTPHPTPPQRPTLRPPPASCTPPALNGPWIFETTVLGAHADRGSSIGVRGFYTIDFAPPRDCTFATDFTKTGFTIKDSVRKVAFRDTPQFTVSPTSSSVSGLAVLRTTPTATDSTDIGFRLMPVGQYLVGLWRYEGAGRVKAGFWGALFGHRPDAEPPTNPRCFTECVNYCHGNREADDPSTEACLNDCAPRLARCDK